MTDKTIPILPCRSIGEILGFYRALGFEVTYRQTAPNTYAVVERGDIELHFFVLKALDAADNWGSCYVRVADVDSLYEAFTTGLRASLGRLPSRGVPRINALRDMSYGVRQFVVVDPGGNYIRIGQRRHHDPADAGRVVRGHHGAVRQLRGPTALPDGQTRIAPDGEVYCFEVNPSPAYSYYEANAGQPISMTLARYLVGDGR